MKKKGNALETIIVLIGGVLILLAIGLSNTWGFIGMAIIGAIFLIREAYK